MNMTIKWSLLPVIILLVTIECVMTGVAAQTKAAESTPGLVSKKSGLVGKLLLTGSSTMAPLMTEIGGRFQALHPEVQVMVEAGGSGRGISNAREGKADIGMASRALTDKESDLFGYAIARDGICIIVQRDNPVKDLTNREVADIFVGRITNWKAVGGRNAPIAVFNPKEGYSSVELFTHYFGIKYPEIKSHRVVGDNPTRIRAIVENPDGITYVSVGEAERKTQTGTEIKLLPVGGVEATSTNIRSGNYPISRPLTLVTKELPMGLVKTFIDFALSSQVTDLILAHDFVPYLD